MEKIAILYICTGKYNILWREFYESFEKFFLTDCLKTYYVFTDADHIEYENESDNIVRIYQKPLEWPYSTLMRFHMFNNINVDLMRYDYIFFVNANGKALINITPEMILPNKNSKEDLVVVKHPAYRNSKRYQYPYDRNFRCKACIPYGVGKIYVQGCLIGGTATAFMKMSKKIAKWIDIDLKKNIIALWHDESYLNKYILMYKRYRLLDSAYVSPILKDGLNVVIHMRPKNNYFNVSNIKKDAKETDLGFFNKIFNNYWYKVAYKNDIYKSDLIVVKKNHSGFFVFLWSIKQKINIFLGK